MGIASEAEISPARAALGRLVTRLRNAAPNSARETLVQALCDGLRSLPVPLVGAFLARVAEDSLLEQSQAVEPATIIDTLDRMQQSDAAFVAGLRRLGADVDDLLADLRAIRETQIGSQFGLARVDVQRRWPVFDHRIGALLLNRGGGLVVLDELHLDVQDWSSSRRADLTVPAAPLPEIRLKATLDVRTPTYPLFVLNGEAPHQFLQALGAERLELDLDSRQNACFQLRLRAAYYDAEADNDRELVWPSASEPPLELDFPWAPGWRSGMELLDRDDLLAGVEQRVNALVEASQRGEDTKPLEGISRWQLPILAHALRRELLDDNAGHANLRHAVRRLEAAGASEGRTG